MKVESLHLRRDEGVEMIVAIDSTRRGPALGGCRWKLYPSSLDARLDACELAGAMTRKAAMARLALGGGKAVVVGDPARRTREQLLAFGDFVESIGGRYVTAADMGTGEEEMLVVAEATSHVLGLPERAGGCGDPSPYTALGVRMAMEAALRHRGLELAGARVMVQGTGHVGAALVRLLLEAGARVAASDVRGEALGALPREVERVEPECALDAECDVLAPCGPPSVLDAAATGRLRCSILCGAANNPLREGAARRLAGRGVLYVPDFVASAGGLIHLAVAREGGDAGASRARLTVIAENVERVLERAKAERIDPAEAAERIASAALAGGDDAPDLG